MRRIGVLRTLPEYPLKSHLAGRANIVFIERNQLARKLTRCSLQARTGDHDLLDFCLRHHWRLFEFGGFGGFFCFFTFRGFLRQRQRRRGEQNKYEARQQNFQGFAEIPHYIDYPKGYKLIPPAY